MNPVTPRPKPESGGVVVNDGRGGYSGVLVFLLSRSPAICRRMNANSLSESTKTSSRLNRRWILVFVILFSGLLGLTVSVLSTKSVRQQSEVSNLQQVGWTSEVGNFCFHDHSFPVG